LTPRHSPRFAGPLGYWGARPVAKGWNNRRHIAEAGGDDTFVADGRWRAVCFSSGEPRGLSVSLAEVFVRLKDILAEHFAMLGFDRGGSYPKVFSAIADEGWDWVTWRRAPLLTPRVEPRLTWVQVGDKRRYLYLADELVELAGYDSRPVRQISAFEDDKVVFQVLTSDTAVKAARAKLKEATDELAEAERALGAAMDAGCDDVDDYLERIASRRDRVAISKDDPAEEKDALKHIPAKLLANEPDPNAKRAKPALAARSLQMVCRLLAYNAELGLARRLNAYLDDLDEYRAITRNLLPLGGTIAYARREITVSLDRPDSPRIARALQEPIQEINAGPPVHLAGDYRRVTSQVRGS